MDMHKIFNTSSADLQAATADVHRLRKEIAAAAVSRQKDLEKLQAAEADLNTAGLKLDSMKDAFLRAVSSDDEDKVILAIQRATAALQAAQTVYDGRKAKFQSAPDMTAAKAELEAAMERAISCIPGSELNRLPDETVSVLHAAFTAYQGCSSLDWPHFLAMVVPQMDTKDRAATYAQVLESYGLN